MAIPKRSYILQEVVTDEGTSYRISFRDGHGKIQKLYVSHNFYMAFRSCFVFSNGTIQRP